MQMTLLWLPYTFITIRHVLTFFTVHGPGSVVSIATGYGLDS